MSVKEAMRIESVAVAWHSQDQSLYGYLIAEYSGFIDGLNGRKWRAKPPRGDLYGKLWSRLAWEAGCLAREMEATR